MVSNAVVSGVKGFLRIALQLYFKEIRHAPHQLDQRRPLLFLANHQNALIDALLIAAFNRRKTYFLVRSDVFKRKWVASVLHYFGLRPIFRIRDGKHLVSQNEPMLNFFAEVLVKGDCVLLFPEGNHSLKRSIRPLRKGFIDIADKAFALDRNLDLGLVTIGLSYQNATCFRDRVHIHYADAIDAKSLFVVAPDKTTDKKERDKEILAFVHQRLSTCTVHIASEHYDDIERQLICEKADFLQVQAVNARIAELTEHTSSGPNAECLALTAPCEVSRLKVVISILFWPLVLIWRRCIRPMIKEDEFVSTLRFAYFTLILLVSVLLFALFLICLL
jgi:1-acyl-sn-glycerol-3-phosphate acyltransferase